MNEKRCVLCGEDFEPEASRYDDICDECAEAEDEEYHEAVEAALYGDDEDFSNEISPYSAW